MEFGWEYITFDYVYLDLAIVHKYVLYAFVYKRDPIG